MKLKTKMSQLIEQKLRNEIIAMCNNNNNNNRLVK